MQNSPAAMQFVDRLLEEKGMEGVEEGVRLQLRADLLQRMDEQINRMTIDALSPDQLSKFEHLLDTNQTDKIQSFLEKSGVNMQAIIARVMTEFRARYLEE